MEQRSENTLIQFDGKTKNPEFPQIEDLNFMSYLHLVWEIMVAP